MTSARLALCAAAAFLLPAGPVAAVDLAFPGPARLTLAEAEAPGSVALPAGPWADGRIELRRAEGRVERRAVRIEGAGQSTLSLIAPLRGQLEAEGFALVFECETRACGGFDFRFAAGVLPEPEMHVDLGDFRYLLAERGEDVVAVMVSRSSTAGFAQITEVTAADPAAMAPDAAAFVPAGSGDTPQAPRRPDGPDPAAAPAAPVLATAEAPGPVTGSSGAVSLSSAGTSSAAGTDAGADADGGLRAALDATGRAVLEDLVFRSGETALAGETYASLAALAAWLEADPARRIALVGHTDAAGALEANIAVSRRRAEAVRGVLIRTHGVAPARVTAQGVGFLSPRASNATEEGRQANRRVEAVVVAD